MQSHSENPEAQRDDGTTTDLAVRAAQRARQMLDAGESRDNILAMIANAAEHVSGGGVVCSILVLDSEGLLRNGASPNLPADYLKSIDRLKPNPQVGTCSAAAATDPWLSLAISVRMTSGLSCVIYLCHSALSAHGVCRLKQPMGRCWGPSEPISASDALRCRQK